MKNMKRTNVRRREDTGFELYEHERYLIGEGEANEYAEIEFSDLVTDEEYSMLKWQTLFKIPVRDIAAAMGITEEACKKRLQRTKKRMRKILSEKI